MIQIRHAELAFIQENYTKSIVPKIINKCEIVERLIELLQSPKKTTYDDIKGYYYPFTSALGGVLNDNKLGIKNKGELLRKIENLRVTSCYKIRIIHIQNKIVFLKDKNNLIKLISSLPFNLKELQNQYLKNIELLFSDLLIKFLFDYEYFYRDNIAPIAENLNLIVCPYCNRNYITHIKGKNKKEL